jgi:hypothetical protein
MNRFLIALIFFILLKPLVVFSESNVSSDKQIKKFAYDSLKNVMVYSLEKNLTGEFDKEIADPSGLIILLADVDTKEARNVLLQLIEVSIGAANAEALTYSIMKQGKKIRSGLNAMVTQPIQCSLLRTDIKEKTKSVLRCFTQEERDAIIINLIKYIDEGKKPYYDL